MRFLILAVAMALLAVVLAARSLGESTQSDHARFHRQHFRVTEVVAGDALRLTRKGDEAAFTVRLVGVDAHGLTAARAAAADVLGDGQVLLYLENVPTRNHAGELIAYVYAADGTLLNQRLIEEGAAFADRRWDYSFLRTFLQAEEQARTRGRGLWPQMTEEQMPEWRRRWLAELQKEPWRRQEWRRRDEP